MNAGTLPRAAESLHRNARLFYATQFFSAAMFSLPIYILFGVDYLGVSVFAAGALFLISWIVSLVLDFVSGGIADKFGKQQVYIVGVLLQIAGTVPFVFTKNYAILVACSVVIGIGMALASNTLQALLYEQAREQDKLRYFQHLNGLSGAFFYFGRIAASIIGGFMYLVQPTLPYTLTAIALGFALCAGLAMRFASKVERETETQTHWGIMREAWQGFVVRPRLVWFAVIIGLISIWGDFIFSMYQPYYTELGVTSVTLGYLYAGISLVSAVGSLWMRRLPDKYSPETINSFAIIGVLLTPLGLLLLHLPLALLAPAGLALVSGFTSASLNLLVNHHAPDRVRSSMLSIFTTIMGVGSAIGIFAVLQLMGRVSFQAILFIAIIGCLVTLIANIAIAYFGKDAPPQP